MKAPLSRCIVQALHRFNGFNFFRAFILGGFLFPLLAYGQSFAPDKNFTRSISGQFIVFGETQFSSLAGSPKVAADTNFVRLQPALLAVSAERIKDTLGRRLEVRLAAPLNASR